MDENLDLPPNHPAGELTAGGQALETSEGNHSVETFGGKVFVRWDADGAVTAMGPGIYFIEFLKSNGLWQRWVDDCPLHFTSPNAPTKTDVLGTLLLSVLAGQRRYAHVTAIRGDSVMPGLLGMRRIMSQDSVRRAFLNADRDKCTVWLQTHLDKCYQELLTEKWILDVDGSVKPLYGQQEYAVRGYNPTKQGRPSHVYQTYFIAAIRMVLDVEVQPGNQTASIYAQPGLWAWLDRRPRQQWPALIRGDIGWGTEVMMEECERRQVPYLFKIRQTTNVKKHIAGLFDRKDWQPAGGEWQGMLSELKLCGWTKKRQVMVLRRPIREWPAGKTKSAEKNQQTLFADIEVLKAGELYEYAVLVTTLEEEVLGLAQLYRDRAEAENVFDEMKNQWGWTGFTTQDAKRCQILARMIALIYNWWSLYTRLAIPNRHTEATTTRPLMLDGIGRQTKHSNQTTITLTSNHEKAEPLRKTLEAISSLLQTLTQSATQFTLAQRWRWLLRYIFRDWLKNCAPDTALLPITHLVNCRI